MSNGTMVEAFSSSLIQGLTQNMNPMNGIVIDHAHENLTSLRLANADKAAELVEKWTSTLEDPDISPMRKATTAKLLEHVLKVL